MAVQFGVHIGAQNATVEELRALWKWLDAAGVDWISLWDHLYEAPPAGGTQPHFEAFSMLGALAVDTSRARIGCLVFCSQYRNIGVLMKGAISVDHLSGGRFELGMGSGWHDQEAAAFGIDFPSQGGRFKVLEGQLGAITKWRSGERVTQTTPGVQLTDASMVPGVMGKMPLWIGGLGPKQTLRMAGAYADGWNAAYANPSQYKELNGILDDWCVKAGREPSAVERSINLSYGLSNDDIGAVKSQLEKQWGAASERIISGSLLGRPEDAMEQIAPFIDAGAQMVNIAIRPPWNQELLAEYIENVLPAMRKEWS
ncbi:MAG: LLM class flavin-dependent oxidoreductase [Acidimicrobiaceae bacterium]|jgi:alkanesulfonate monooxygenase SsuD/methylene tetrahydromethanopterin reductase-like flavin-dependent oxidoreductase (luciferase family)|nr:LLM class flavin-dependent oxidoreductase [Ilumatobacteraceae bacterium]